MCQKSLLQVRLLAVFKVRDSTVKGGSLIQASSGSVNIKSSIRNNALRTRDRIASSKSFSSVLKLCLSPYQASRHRKYLKFLQLPEGSYLRDTGRYFDTKNLNNSEVVHYHTEFPRRLSRYGISQCSETLNFRQCLWGL